MISDPIQEAQIEQRVAESRAQNAEEALMRLAKHDKRVSKALLDADRALLDASRRTDNLRRRLDAATQSAVRARRSCWLLAALCVVLLLALLAGCRSDGDSLRGEACRIERAGHDEWTQHPEYHCKGNEIDHADCGIDGNCRWVPTGCQAEPTMQDCR